MRIVITTGSPRRKPKAGDTKTVRGVEMIRQQQRHAGAYVVSGGRPVWEWVPKGSDRDRSAKKAAQRGEGEG